MSRFPVQISDCGDLPGGKTMESVSTWDKKLYSASFNGDKLEVIFALAQGGRVTMRNTQGFTPLMAAAQNGHTDICGLLLAHSSNVNEVVPDTKHTALHLAVSKGHNTLIEALLSWGAEVHPQSHAGVTPLHFACQEGHLLCVLALLKAGASLTLTDNQGFLPIHHAAQYNRVEIVKTLLEHGCSPDMVRWNKQSIHNFFSQLDSKMGSTPLHYWLRSFEGVQFIFENLGSYFIKIFQIDCSNLPFILTASEYLGLILKTPNELLSGTQEGKRDKSKLDDVQLCETQI